MSVFKRPGNENYEYDFVFRGQRYRKSTGLRNKESAKLVESKLKIELAEGRAGIARQIPSPIFEDFVNNEYLPWSKNSIKRIPEPTSAIRWPQDRS